MKKRLKLKYGKWAVITGATSGIGLELTKLLGEAGLNLIITSRESDRLQQLGASLQQSFNTEIKTVVSDVAKPADVGKIIQASQGLDIGLLIASAGFGTSGLFTENPLLSEINMLKVNCEAALSLTHYYSRQFVQQKRGGIILMSSMLAFQAVPYSANYAATKAYIQSLAEALAVELKPQGVDVLAAAPGPVESGFGKRANMKMPMSLKPSEVGVPILKALGRKTTVLPGILTKVLVYSLGTVPRWAKVKIMEKVMGGMTAHQRK